MSMERETETSGFLDGRGYTAAFLYEFFSLLVGNGVYAGELSPTATNDNMTITHGSGHAWINGVCYKNKSPFALDIATADGNLNRYDSLMLRLDLSANETYAVIVQGTPAKDPTPPSVTRNAEIFELKICDIYIPAGCTKITQAQVTDTRLNASVCGVPVFPVQHLDLSTFYQQIAADLLHFREKEQNDFVTWTNGQEESRLATMDYLVDVVRRAKNDNVAEIMELLEQLKDLVSDDAVGQLIVEINDKLSTSGGTMKGAVNMGGNKVTDLAEPENGTDAATKNYVDGKHEDILSKTKLLSLWKNASPSTAYPAQTLVLDVSKYDFIAVTCRQYSGSTVGEFTSILKTDIGIGQRVSGFVPGNTRKYERDATITSEGIKFGTGYWFEFLTDNSGIGDMYAVPYEIYGIRGIPGTPGKSAYDTAKDNGFEGTEEEWLKSLRATATKTAYEYAKDGGYTGTEEEFTAKMAQEAPTKLPNPHALTINGQNYDGSEPVDIEIEIAIEGDTVKEDAVGGMINDALHSVIAAGAVGDGVHNDTEAFEMALKNNRKVFVPGGTFALSRPLVIRENCCLELSQDTVLKFTQTEGNCIEMRGSAVLRGNYAVLVAPYGLTGKVICMDTLLDGYGHKSIPPYEQQDPQWKRQRFVYDVNIIMPNSEGYNRPLADGVCSGTAVYMSATNQADRDDDVTFMWGIVTSGVRIAGGFSRGIHAINYNSGWNHDMRIEAVIEGCEVGVELDHCNGAHLNVSIQPNVSMPGEVKYAKQGVVLRNSRYVDMMRSRVWDWHVARNDSEEYKHIALYGNCSGLLLDDFLVHEHPNIDIRDDIYTDTASNFDTMTILQEPGNKRFKSIDNVPYFNDGVKNRKLMLATDKFSAEQAEFIQSADGYYTYVPNYTNLVNGYHDGYYLSGKGALIATADPLTTTDYIPVDGSKMHTYRIGGEGIKFNGSEYDRVEWYDADKNVLGTVMPSKFFGTSEYYPAWVEDESVAGAFITLSTQSNMTDGKAAYFRITARGKGENLIVTIDEKQENKAIWHGEPKRLDESIYAKNTFLVSPNGTGFRLIVNNDGTLGTELME